MRRDTAGVDGLLVVDKPGGWTSHDVVARVRRLAGTRRVGHAGTLDPMATGVLVLGLGRATRLLTYLVGADKEYHATIRLGLSTVTDDAEGEALESRDASGVTLEDVLPVVRSLTGPIAQVPSAVSAVKVDGRRSYARVRAGEEVVLPPRPVTVHRFEVIDLRRVHGTAPAVADPAVAAPAVVDPAVVDPAVVDLDVEVACSSGTYVRALARDLGEALSVGGHLTALRRTRVGPYGLDVATTLDALQERFALLPLAQAARTAFPAREVDHEQAVALSHGRRLTASGQGDGPVAAFAPDGSLVALLEDRDGSARPLLVLAPAG